MRDDGQAGEDERGPEGMFLALRGREVPEVDSRGLWRRVRPALQAPRSRWWQQLAPSPAARLAWAAGLTAVAVLGIWTLRSTPQAPVAEAPSAAPPEAPLVLLADEPLALTTVPAEEPPLATLDLDVRLVRAYDGVPPADALPEGSAGAGGARLLGDLRPTLSGLVPGREFAVVGAWDGELEEGGLEAALSPRLRIAFDAHQRPDGVRLTGLRLRGTDVAGLAGELVMQPDRVYVLGVSLPGETEPLLLALRLRERREQD